MAEKVAEKSLSDMALSKTLLSRRDSEQAASSGKLGEQSKFKSYMRSFMDNKDSRTAKASSNNRKNSYSQKDAVFGFGSSAKSGKSRDSSTVKQDKGGIGSNRMTAEERSELRKALSKTTAEEQRIDDRQFDCLALFYNSFISNPDMEGDLSFSMTSQEMQDAANEAAQLIWGLLFPDGTVGAGTGTGGGAAGGDSSLATLAQIANYLNSSDVNPGLAGSDSVGLEAGDLEATNASAEMNIDAVLANLEELLDGMPRNALEQALRRTADASGLSPESAFQKAAEQLGLEVTVDGSTQSASDLLSTLQGSHYAAESAEADDTPLTTVEKALQKIAELDSTLSDSISGLPKDFIEWLESEDNPFKMSVLSEDSVEMSEALFKSLNTYLSQVSDNLSTEESSQLSAIISNLEKILQSSQSKTNQVANGTGSEKMATADDSTESALQDASKLFSAASGNNKGAAATASTATGTTGGTIMATDFDAQDELLSGVAKTNDLARDNAQAANGNNNSTAAQTVGKPTATTSSTSTMLDQMANIERLTEIMRQNSRNGVRNLTMQLSPPDLGKVMVRVESRNGVVSATFRVEQADSASQLQNGMQQLRDNLRAHGIEVGEFQVRYDSFSADADGRGQNRNADPEFSFGNDRRGSGAGHDDANDDQLVHNAAGSTRNADGSLNFFA